MDDNYCYEQIFVFSTNVMNTLETAAYKVIKMILKKATSP